MIKVEAIVRTGSLKKVMAALLKIDYPGVTVYEVQGHGRQRGVKEHYRDQTALALVTKLKLECVVSGPAEAKVAIHAITEACRTGHTGDGKIFCYPLTDVIRIRTGEKGTYAINDSAHLLESAKTNEKSVAKTRPAAKPKKR